MDAFAQEIPALLERASNAGIAEILTASTSLGDAERNLEIARSGGPVRVRAAVGFHPHQASLWRDGDHERLEALLSDENVVAVGETGLDYHYDFSPRDRQREVFARQVNLAARVRKPIVVHCRNAAGDVATILESEGGRESGGVIHCFTENDEFARRCLDLGFFISFSGMVTFKKAGSLRETARWVPEDRLLVETDSPYLAPEPHRGKRNEPALAAVVLAALADLRGRDRDSLASAVNSNFHRFIRATRTEQDAAGDRAQNGG
jgi:TatD DNase family protein